MNGSRNVVLWIGAFVGLALIYSAYKNKAPLTAITQSLAGKGTNTVPPAGTTTGAPSINTPTVPGPYLQYPNSYIPNTQAT